MSSLSSSNGSSGSGKASQIFFKSLESSFGSSSAYRIKWEHYQNVVEELQSWNNERIISITVCARPIRDAKIPLAKDQPKHWSLNLVGEEHLLTLQFWVHQNEACFGYLPLVKGEAELGEFYKYQEQKGRKIVSKKLEKIAFFDLKKYLKYELTFAHVALGIAYFYHEHGGKYNFAFSNCQTFVKDVVNVLIADVNWDKVDLENIKIFSNSKISGVFNDEWKKLSNAYFVNFDRDKQPQISNNNNFLENNISEVKVEEEEEKKMKIKK